MSTTTTTSTGTIPAGPIFPATEVVTYNATPSIGTAFTVLKTVKVALDGEKKNEGTRKLVSDWLKTNKKTIKDAALTEELDVSSWACVIDITFGVMAGVRRLVGTGTTATEGNYQAKGAVGDNIAVLVNKDGGSYTQGALRVAAEITTAYVAASTGVTGVAQVSSYVADTRTPTFSATIDYTKTSQTASAATWSAAIACSTKFSGACNGLSSPWGMGTMVTPKVAVGTTAAVTGSLRAYKWLGDKGSKAAKVMQFEKKDKMNVLAYEFVDQVYTAASTGVTASWSAAKVNWAVVQYEVTGASTLVASAAALVAASQLF